jgi:hypothetical protein
MSSAERKPLHVTPPPRLYTADEDQQILQGIVVLKKSCKELGELLGRDRRSVNKRFKILISRGKKQQPQLQSEPAGAVSLAQQQQQKKKNKKSQASKKVTLVASKPYRVVGFTAKGKPIVESQAATAAAPDIQEAELQQPKAAAASNEKPLLQQQQQQHRKFTPSEDRDIQQGIIAGIPASVIAAKLQRTERDIQQRFVRIDAYEREQAVNARRLKLSM